MGLEIERKFLVTGDGWRTGAGMVMRQGYLSRFPGRTVRVRLAGDAAWLTIKGPTTDASRAEFEYAIPVEDAAALLALCEGPLIEKTRHVVRYRGHDWDVDEFQGANAGLVVAEVELAARDEAFERPEWLGAEVTADHRYANASLVSAPWPTWPENAGR